MSRPGLVFFAMRFGAGRRPAPKKSRALFFVRRLKAAAPRAAGGL